MDSKTTFHGQMSSFFTKVSLVFLATVIFLIYLIYARETELEFVNDSSVPTLQKQAQLHQLTWQSLVFFEQLINSSPSDSLSTSHQNLIVHLEQVKQMTPAAKRQLTLLIARLEKLKPQVSTLSEHVERNALLRRAVMTQLQLVRDQLQQEMALKQPELAALNQQIIDDKVTDDVTVSRARAHLILNDELLLIGNTLDDIIELQVVFERLTARSELAEFNYRTNALEQSLQQWKTRLIAADNTNATTSLDQVLQELQALMFGEQNAVAKWRGHIRIATEYFEQIKNERKSLIALITPIKVSKIAQTQFPSVIANAVKQYVDYDYRTYLLSVLVIVICMYCLFAVWVRTAKRKVKQFDNQVTTVVSDSIRGEEIDKSYLSNQTLTTINEYISQAFKPEHSEQDYQQLHDSLQALHAFYATHLDVAYTEIKAAQPVIPTPLQPLLNKNHEGVYSAWRKIFDKKNLRVLLATARASKASQSSAHCIVENIWRASLGITLEYIDSTWKVLVQDRHVFIESQQALIEENNNAQTTIKALRQDHQQKLLELQLNVTRALLQGQNFAKGYEEHYHQIYRRLQDTIVWCQQALFLSANNDKQQMYTADLDFNNFIQSVAHNIALQQKSKTNRVFLTLNGKIERQVTLNQPFVSDFLFAIGKLVLQEQISASLCLSADIKDVNPGQQVLTISYEVRNKGTKNKVPAIVKLLAKHESNAISPLVVQYVKALRSVLHIEEIRIESSKEGFILSFELPLATQSNTHHIDDEQHVDLKQQQIYVLSNDELIKEKIQQSVIAGNGKVEVFSTVEHVFDALHIKHLKQHAIAALIITPDIGKKGYDAIKAYFTSIPSKIAPKLLFLHSYSGGQLTQQGLCTLADGVLTSRQIVTSIKQLTQSDADNNVLVSADKLSTFRFNATKIEALVASSQLSKQAPLLTLLQWLGLKVTTVSEPQQAINQWKTGKYILLFTDFLQSPYIELSAGRKLIRGVFHLGATKLDLAKPEAFQHWHIDELAPIDQLEQLIEQLKPWLAVQHYVKSPKTINSAVTKAAPVQENSVVEHKGVNTEVSLDEQGNGDSPPFDLVKYAANQGTPELAVFMLDDYIKDISQAIVDIKYAVKHKNKTQFKEQFILLTNRCRILAAHDLLLSVEALNDAMISDNEQSTDKALQAVISQKQSLVQFCEAI
ncbi:hypothetical protein [Thalassotalea sediminis]|uniref:hypothetical protein n=1 Tax=Thalassotalea sediminis TaxID=1759089 RepID=UPI002572A3B0|nr:hypothetical protein [Thalassotalea sediminis]